MQRVKSRREVYSTLWCLSRFPSCPFCTVNQIRCYIRASSKLLHAENRYCSWFLCSKSQTCDGNAVTMCTNEVMIMSRSAARSTCSGFTLPSEHSGLKPQLSIFNHHTILVTLLDPKQDINYCINYARLGHSVSAQHIQ